MAPTFWVGAKALVLISNSKVQGLVKSPFRAQKLNVTRLNYVIDSIPRENGTNNARTGDIFSPLRTIKRKLLIGLIPESHLAINIVCVNLP